MRHGVALLAVSLSLLVLCSTAALAEGEHEPYADWIPSGTLDVGNDSSEAAFAYTAEPQSQVSSVAHIYRDRAKVADTVRSFGSGAAKETFKVTLRETRFGIVGDNLVIVRRHDLAAPGQTLFVYVDGELAGEWPVGANPIDAKEGGWTDNAFAIPAKFTKDKKEVTIAVANSDGTTEPAPMTSCLYDFYMTRDWKILGESHTGALPRAAGEYGAGGEAALSAEESYLAGLAEKLDRDYGGARALFERAAAMDLEGGDLWQISRRQMRECLYRQASDQLAFDSAKAQYGLGLYCMECGFFGDAKAHFEASVDLDPSNPDAWYMLADAGGYADGQLGDEVEGQMDYYRRSAALYDVIPNVWRIYVGILKAAYVGEEGSKKLMEMTDEKVESIKKEWGWACDMVWAASRGSFKLKTDFHVIDQPAHPDDPEFLDSLFSRGDYDCTILFYEGGPADTMGMDCGPNRTSITKIGTWAGWEVFLHEWNHALDWTMISTEAGVGVPVTHGSDWCGYQPIPSMGCGHRSLNRYFMTPGMYEVVKGYDPPTTPYIRDWLVLGPYVCLAGEGLKQEFARHEQALEPTVGDSYRSVPWVEVRSKDDFVDLAFLAEQAKATAELGNSVAYAACYVYSPTKQKVRMWLGMSDGARVWVNRKLVHEGGYHAICNWEEAQERDQLSCPLELEEGWNSMVVKVENIARTPEELAKIGRERDTWGFSIRLSGMNNEALEGVTWQIERPEGFSPRTGLLEETRREFEHYNWHDVACDYTFKLPRLTQKEIAIACNHPGLEIEDGDIDGVFIHSYGKNRHGEAYGAGFLVGKFDPKDVLLNNELNWKREAMALVRYAKPEGRRMVPGDLIFLKPDKVEAYLSLMQLPDMRTAKRMDIRSHMDRVIGYYVTKESDGWPHGRTLIVVDTYLGETVPDCEKDLLDVRTLVP
jgi:tetratricopeptide (TPR) repeat protein